MWLQVKDNAIVSKNHAKGLQASDTLPTAHHFIQFILVKSCHMTGGSDESRILGKRIFFPENPPVNGGTTHFSFG